MSTWADLRRAAADPRVASLLDAVDGCSYDLRLTDVPVAAEMLASRGAERLGSVRGCIRVMQRAGTTPFEDLLNYPYMLFLDFVRELVRRTPPSDLAEADLCALVDVCSGTMPREPGPVVIAAIEARYADMNVPARLRDSLTGYLDRLETQLSADARRLRERIRKLLLDVEQRRGFAFGAVDAWTLAMVQELERVEPEARGRWLELLAHAAGASGNKPTRAWQKRAGELVCGIGLESFRAVMGRVLEQVGRAAPFPVQVPGWEADWVDGDATLVSQQQADALRGLIWCAGEDSPRDPALIAAIGGAAERCYKKVAGIGPRAPKIANACVGVLSRAGGQRAVTELSRLATRVKHPSSRKQIDKALEQAAERAGLSREELEDMAVPSCGLTGPGLLERELGAYRAVLRATSSTTVELQWWKDDKVQKSVPAAVKESYAAELGELKRSAEELKKLLPAERDRLERMCMSPRVVPYAQFRERFLDHPVLGFLARRLIWKVGEPAVLAIHDGRRLVDRSGAAVEPEAGASVQLWHPIESTPEDVLAWREYLVAHELVQPFKQAHREIYVLTDAERGTGSYSNRFVAHILRQHQFNALCSARGWQYRLQGGFDSANTPLRLLPEHGLRAEFWVEAPDLGTLSEAGIFLYITTDQVRFCDARGDAVPLVDVPPRVFSEIMRDVDLFVGVTSVGNDPNWLDGGERGAGYWHAYAFGELGETAKTRRQVLERLVPMLKIGKQCAIEDRFLVVNGRFRQYRIHLGSGNVLMSPNQQYLCIVPDRSAGRPERVPGELRLPFEGDAMLSLILSKAILLADDHEITDASIQSQIGVEHYAN